MRAMLHGLLASIGGIGVLGISIFFAIKSASWGVFFICLAVGIFIIVIVFAAIDKTGRINMKPWLSKHSDCAYKYAWDGSGIALDVANKKVCLKSYINKQPISRDYSFSEVREWGYQMPGAPVVTGGVVFGAGVQGAAHNIGKSLGQNFANTYNEIDAVENTGLWLKVKDIDHPQWFIKFECESSQDKKVENELIRWMEILQQNFNEGVQENA